MQALVRQWEAGDEPRTAFARRHGLTVSRFDYWKRQVRYAPSTDLVALAPVQVLADAPARGAAAIEVVFPRGECVTIQDGVSVDLVRTVIATLRASC